MKKNAIILTHGWTGSSVYSALFGTQGFWTGDETAKKPDYDTFENQALVDLNRRMMKDLQFTKNHEHQFSIDDVRALEAQFDKIDQTPYRDFATACTRNSPFVWKDPRLTWTIRQWNKVMDFSNSAFLILTRDDTQAWISCNLRRHVQSMAFTRYYNHGITDANVEFLEKHRLPYVRLSFEDLLLTPDAALDKLNKLWDLSLSLDVLKKVYREPLYKKSRSTWDYFVALAIYIKNYGERDGRGKLASGPA